MNSLTLRLTAWFTVLVTLTVGLLLVFGGWLLHRQLLQGLDVLNTAEFDEIKARLGPNYQSLTPKEVDDRIRHHTEIDAPHYFFQIHNLEDKILFRSANLDTDVLPDLTGQKLQQTVYLREHGQVRMVEFHYGPWHVQIATSTEQMIALEESYRRVALVLVSMVLVASLGLGFGFSRYGLRPVRVIQQTADRIQVDNLSERIPVPDGGGEIADLARLLNKMFDRLESSFSQIKRFTADASHELKTPLSLVRLQAEKLVESGRLESGDEKRVSDLLSEAERLRRIIDDLLLLAKVEGGSLEEARQAQNPVEFIEDFAQDGAALAEDAGVTFRVVDNEPGWVSIDERWIRQVLLNLTTNAIRVSPLSGEVVLSSRFVGNNWRVSIQDDGPGVPDYQMPRLFERFVRLGKSGRDNREGTGLGLAICRGILQHHSGRIWAENRKDSSGLCVVFEIPVGTTA